MSIDRLSNNFEVVLKHQSLIYMLLSWSAFEQNVFLQYLSEQCSPGTVIHMEQTYCLPDRIIMDEIFLTCNLVDVFRLHLVNFVIVFQVRRKPWVGWMTLVCFLHSRGLILRTVFWHGLIYYLVKMLAGLSWPILVWMMIRQPSLCSLREWSQWSRASSCNYPLVVAAYRIQTKSCKDLWNSVQAFV